MCVLQLTIHPLFVSSLLFYCIKLFCMDFSFLVFEAIGYTIIYTIILQQHFHIFGSVFLLI